MRLEARARAVEALSEVLQRLGDERVGVLHGRLRIVDELRLQNAPPLTQLVCAIGIEERLEAGADVAALFVPGDGLIRVVADEVARLDALAAHDRTASESRVSTSSSNRSR